MAYVKAYQRIQWRNRPSTTTAVSATNLNRMDAALNTLDDRIVNLDASKLNIETANSMIKNIHFDTTTGIVTINQLDGTVQSWNINLEKIPMKMSLREDAVLILETEDGLYYEADLKELIDTYIFDDSDTIGFTNQSKPDGKHICATVKNGSITEEKLKPSIMGDILQNKLDSQEAAADALLYMKDAKSAAVGGEHEGDAENNAKYYCGKAQNYAEMAEEIAKIKYPDVGISTGTGRLFANNGKGFDLSLSNGHLISHISLEGTYGS